MEAASTHTRPADTDGSIPVIAIFTEDHTIGILAPAVAVALGAEVIEKHFTLDKSLPGTDHVLSVTPDELKQMIEYIRLVEVLLGEGVKRPTAQEESIREFVRSRFPKG